MTENEGTIERGGKVWRSRYVVNPRFFFWFLKVMISASVSMGVLLGALFGWYHHHVVQTLTRHGWMANKLIQEEVAAYGDALLLTFGIAFIVMLLFMVLLGALLAHRISGPLYKLGLHVDEALSGQKVAPLGFRKQDHFHEVAESLNKVMERAGLLRDD